MADTCYSFPIDRTHGAGSEWLLSVIITPSDLETASVLSVLAVLDSAGFGSEFPVRECFCQGSLYGLPLN